MLMKFTFIFLGLLFGYRIFKISAAKFSVEKIAMTKIGTIACGFLILSLYFPSETTIFYLFIVSFPDLLRFIRQKTDAWRARRSFKKEFSVVLNEIIVRMSGGASFRQAFLKCIEGLNAHSQKFWREIFEIVTFSQQIPVSYSSDFRNLILKEFREADQKPQSALRKLKIFRRRYNLMQNFRHRSGAMTKQTRLQCYIMIGLYLFLSAIVLWNFEWRKSIEMILLSAGLFGAGSLWTLSVGRRLKWNL
jgi:hypothetical protein